MGNDHRIGRSDPGRTGGCSLTRILSWNVNGIRAVERKGFLPWLQAEQPDILCVQETKAQPDQLSEHLLKPDGFISHFSSAERKGYSGVGVYTRRKPVDVSYFGAREFDDEGRLIVLHFDGFSVVNGYFPNSQEGGARLSYKLEFCEALRKQLDSWVSSGQHVIVCGDYNIAHREIDLARPRENEQNPGFLPEEREWMTSFLAAGYVDTFRMFENGGGHYTWWSYRAGARQRNIGWRIDYSCVDTALAQDVQASRIRPDVTGSDHCPVELSLAL